MYFARPVLEEKCFAVSKFYVSLEKQNLLRAPPVQAKLQVLPISGDVACNRRVLEAVAQTANEERGNGYAQERQRHSRLFALFLSWDQCQSILDCLLSFSVGISAKSKSIDQTLS